MLNWDNSKNKWIVDVDPKTTFWEFHKNMCRVSWNILLTDARTHGRYNRKKTYLGETTSRACADTSVMALLVGAVRFNLLLNSRGLHKFASFVGVRSLSGNVSSKPVTSRPPDPTSDHLIYTPEHFALKEALRKVCKMLLTIWN